MDELGPEGLKAQSLPCPARALIQDSRALPGGLKALEPRLQACFFGFCPWECSAKLGNPIRVFIEGRAPGGPGPAEVTSLAWPMHTGKENLQPRTDIISGL